MKMNIQCIAFDAYGTLCYIADPTHPFANLLKQTNMAASRARRLCMTHNLTLAELVEFIAPACTPSLAAIEKNVQRELASVRLFAEVEDTLDRLRARGFKLALASNLAVPYAQPVQALLGGRIDHYIWSFEVGTIKPDPAIFEALCVRLAAPPTQVLMVGDSMRADVVGARGFGMPALHLARKALHRSRRSITTLSDVVSWLDAHRSYAVDEIG